jgi:hypothetical protein
LLGGEGLNEFKSFDSCCETGEGNILVITVKQVVSLDERF